jgi:ADP-heptose:LPS heptosyltransferase
VQSLKHGCSNAEVKVSIFVLTCFTCLIRNGLLLMPKFLIIRFSSIGDVVLTTPVIRCLKQQVPHAEVHFLTKPEYAGLLQHNPYLSGVHVLNKSLSATARALKKRDFDAIIDLHHNLRTLLLKTMLQIPAFAYPKLNLEKWLLVNLRINKLPSMHVVDRYMQTVQNFGVRNDGLGLDYFFGPEQVALPALPAGYVAFAIGAQHATKRMPNEKIREICRNLPMPVVLLGGKTDEANGELIARQAGGHVINYCGKLSLEQSAAVVNGAQKIITHDTGLMHIAAALKKDVVSIWGNTIPEFGMSAYRGTQTFSVANMQVGGLACRPCSKIGHSQCPKKHFNCMQLQNISAICEAVLR